VIGDEAGGRRRQSPTAAFAAGGVLGVIAFLCLWGATLLNPNNLRLFVEPYGTDISFSAIGVLKFLGERWHPPPGVIEGLVYPSKTSVVYIDGIPLVALIAKLLTSVLGHSFQYFGLWSLFCAVLQGAISATTIFKYARDWILAAVGCVFFIFCPFFLGKMFGHVSMAGQWVILVPLLFITYRDSEWMRRWDMVLWAGMAAVSAGVLAYFTPMVALLSVLYYWLGAEQRGFALSARRCALTLLLSAAAAVAMMWLAGGFLPGMEPVGANYGDYPYNLNGLINPGWASKLLPGMSSGTAGGEGFSWLGLGIVAGAAGLLIRAAYRRRLPANFVGQWLPFIVVALAFIAFAATNVVMFGNVVLFSYPLPEHLRALLSTFRTSARFIWPVWYMVVILVVGSLVKLRVPWLARFGLLTALLCLQLWDGSSFRAAMTFPAKLPALPPLKSALWQHLRPPAKHLYILPVWGTLAQDTLAQVEYECVRQGVTTNFFWLGRYPWHGIQQGVQDKLDGLRQGRREKDDLLLIEYVGVMRDVKLASDTEAYLADDVLLLGSPGMGKNDAGVRRVTFDTVSFVDYLQHLAEISSRSLIVITGRQTAPAAVLDAKTLAPLAALGFHELRSTHDNFSYAAVASAGKILLEKMTPGPLHLNLKKGQLFAGAALPEITVISIDSVRGPLPQVRIGTTDVSRSLYGLNVAVYDLERREVTESAVFDGFANVPGIVVRPLDIGKVN
jgi:hypothetical protein